MTATRSGTRGPRICTIAFQGYGNVGDEAILAGLDAWLGGELEVVAVFAGPGDVAAFGQAPRVRTWRQLPTLRALRLIRRADALVMAGGGLVNDYWRPVVPRLLLWTLAARLAGRRVVWIGSGVGPIRRRPWRVMAGLAFRLSRLLLVRDDGSAAWVRRCALAPEPTVGPDPAMLLPRPATARPRQGIGIAGRMPLRTDPGAATGLVDAFLDLAAARAATGQHVVFLVFDAPADAPFLARLRSRSESRSMSPPEVQVLPQDPQAVLEQLAGLEGLVTMRLHGLILAALAQTPAVPVSYDPKVLSAARRLGIGDLVVEVDDVRADRLSAALAVAQGSHHRVTVEANLSELRRSADGLRRIILDALSHRRHAASR